MIFNTTYTMSASEERQFCIWMTECMMPAIASGGVMHGLRLLRVLSHQQEESVSYCLQQEVDSAQALHEWYLTEGTRWAEECRRIFGDRVIGFSTLLEEVHHS